MWAVTCRMMDDQDRTTTFIADTLGIASILAVIEPDECILKWIHCGILCIDETLLIKDVNHKFN